MNPLNLIRTIPAEELAVQTGEGLPSGFPRRQLMPGNRVGREESLICA